MRKPSKPCNHFPVPLGIVQIVGKHRPLGLRLFSQQTGKARNGFVLHREVFAVFEHQINEYPLYRLQLPIEIRRNALRDKFCARRSPEKALGVSRKIMRGS